MLELGLLVLLMGGDMNKADVVNKQLSKGAVRSGKLLGTIVNKLEEEKEIIYTKPLKPHVEPKTKADKIYGRGGKFAIDEAYRKGKIEFEDIPESYFKK